MNTDALVKSLFQKESLMDCSIEELQTLAAQYPYFTPVQLLFAEKVETNNKEVYDQQLQRLSLCFNNPLWLDFLLNDDKEPIMSAANASENNRQPVVAEPGFHDTGVHLAGSPEHENKEAAGESDFAPSGSPGQAENIEGAIVNEVVPGEPEDQPIVETPVAKVDTENTPAEHIDSSETNPAPSSLDVNAEATMESLPPARENAEAPISFEPYHTVDYFASQGIRFIPEEKPADRFGQQLKSFTEWLKAMKRLPQAEIVRLPVAPSEEKVQQLADHSISENEVVTETMAEVWLKQGNKEKAIEIYHKLSLLNPEKSAYFASLLEQLKNS